MSRNLMPKSGAMAPYVVVNRDAAVAGVFSVDGEKGAVVLTSKYLQISNYNQDKTATDNTIKSINESIGSLNSAVGSLTTSNNAKAAKGANSDITELNALTKAILIPQGGTGATTDVDARKNLKVFFQNRSSFGANDNLNDYYGFDKTGWYYCAGNAIATPANNYPEQTAGVLLVTSSVANGGNQTLQYYYPYNDASKHYTRAYNLMGDSGWQWSEWTLHLSAAKYGVGRIGNLIPDSSACQFLADSNSGTTWAPANGAGIQSSYGGNRIFQLWMGTGNNMYYRFVDTNNPQEPKTSIPWNRVVTEGMSTPKIKYSIMLEHGTDDTKKCQVGVGGADVYFRNEKNQKVVQIKDDGRLTFSDAEIMHRALQYSGDYEVIMNNFRVVTGGNGLQIKGNDGAAGRAIYVSGINGNGSRAWYLGKGGADGGAIFYNDGGGGNYVSLGADNNVTIRTPSYGNTVYLDASRSILRRSNNRTFTWENQSTASYNGTLLLWGNVDRPSVIECKFDNGYVWYSQYNKDGSRVTQFNSPINAQAFNQSSDRDLKDNLEVIPNAREKIKTLSGYTYTFKDTGMPDAGLIAQEVMEVLPEAVSSFVKTPEGKDQQELTNEEIYNNRYYSLSYSAVTGLLVQAVKEQENEISNLRKEIEELKVVVQALINK